MRERTSYVWQQNSELRERKGGALEREKKEREREHLRDKEKQMGFGISSLVSEGESGTV